MFSIFWQFPMRVRDDRLLPIVCYVPFKFSYELNKIEAQKYKYPNQVHKVPVESSFFDHQVMSATIENSSLCHQQHHDVDAYSGKHVETVEASDAIKESAKSNRTIFGNMK